MELNTPAAIALGRQVHRAFGSWQKAREAATVSDDGVYRIDADTLASALAERQAIRNE